MQIVVAGYPKSGNTWITRLVAELVGCPAKGFWGECDNPDIAIEGQERVSEYSCYKSHHQYHELMAAQDDTDVKIIYVIRDPRDVAISACGYFSDLDISNGEAGSALLDMPEFSRMQNMVISGDNGVHHWCRISWRDHVIVFLQNQIFYVKYEDALDNPMTQCKRILKYLEIERSDEHIRSAIEKQSFKVKKKKFDDAGDKLKSWFMRSGEKDQWKVLRRNDRFTIFNQLLAGPVLSLGYQLTVDSVITSETDSDEQTIDSTKKQKPLLIVQLMGGMGNQMFQFAHGLSLAWRFNLDLKLDLTLLMVRNPNSSVRNRYFQLQEFRQQKKIISSVALDKKGVEFDSDYNRKNLNLISKGVCPSGDTILRGWYQGEKYFRNVVEEVRDVFSFKPFVSSRAREIQLFIEDHPDTVAIHIRRGDYVNHGLHHVCDDNYYLRAKLYIENILDKPHFVIFSDDIGYCRKLLNVAALYVDESITDAESMHLMSLCNHHIISNSTFSWWGAWLSLTTKGKVLAPSRWFNNEQMNNHYLVENKLYPTDWQLIQV